MGVWHALEELIVDDDIDLVHEAPKLVVVARLAYELALLCAAVGSVWLLTVDGRGAFWASVALWLWFATDYLVRLAVANDRRTYVARHRLELVAALPLDVFRPLRALRLLRPLAMLARSTKGLRDVLGLHGIQLLASIGVAVVCLGGSLFVRFEPGEHSWADGLWWAVVTTTTVGYGDISPVTPEGRVVAGLLMITGIGLLGGLTAEIARILFARPVESHCTDPDVAHIAGRLHQWDHLTDDERTRLAGMLTAVTTRASVIAPD